MRIALVSDSISAYGGAERVIEQILSLYPQADIFAVVDVVPPDQRGFLGGRPVRTSFLQKIPKIERLYRSLLPLWPLAVEQFDVTGYDLVITSHHSVAYGVLTRPDQPHVSYVHSPMRYAWDLQHEYLREAKMERGPKSWLARRMLHSARIWDFCAAQRPETMVANSAFVANRLRRTHRREAGVVHPPVYVDTLPPLGSVEKEDYYLSVCRLVPYKRVELLARAFARMPEKRLKIVGNGPELKRLREMKVPNVEVLGRVPTPEVHRLLAGAQAFMFAGIEDFGITAVEAQAAGTPVIAYGAGGLAETVLGPDHDAPTGLFFAEQTEDAVIAAVHAFEGSKARFTPENCLANAQHFSTERFRSRFKAVVDDALERARAQAPAGLHGGAVPRGPEAGAKPVLAEAAPRSAPQPAPEPTPEPARS